MRVLGARVLIKEKKKESNKTSTGIIIPGSENEPTYQGTIIGVGDGATLDNGIKIPLNVKVGDEVVYTSFSGTPIKKGDEEFLILNIRDILCVFD